MKIVRDVLGASETIDLGTAEGYDYFVDEIVQDWDAATELIDAIRHAPDAEVLVNEAQPVFIERYTRLTDAPVYQPEG